MVLIALLSLASTCYAFDSTNASTRAASKAKTNETDSYSKGGRGAGLCIITVGASKAHKKEKTAIKASKKEAK